MRTLQFTLKVLMFQPRKQPHIILFLSVKMYILSKEYIKSQTIPQNSYIYQ